MQDCKHALILYKQGYVHVRMYILTDCCVLFEAALVQNINPC